MRGSERGKSQTGRATIFTYHPNGGNPGKGITRVARIRLAKFKKGVELCKSFSKTSRKFSTNSKGEMINLETKRTKPKRQTTNTHPSPNFSEQLLLEGLPQSLLPL